MVVFTAIVAVPCLPVAIVWTHLFQIFRSYGALTYFVYVFYKD